MIGLMRQIFSIYYNMKRGEVKLAQIAYFLANIQMLEETSKFVESGDHFLGHIICGDFNIQPYSPLYRFLVNGIINLQNFSYNRLNVAFKADEFGDDSSVPVTTHIPNIFSLPLQVMNITSNCQLREQIL